MLTELAEHSRKFGIIVEQAEDEISAINMGLGAWYVGARAMVTTSGGGFALMCEGISLAGITETPMVIHLGQRPGPATGLPTRTEQGDLNLVLYAGHGEFPRIILAPGSLEQAFYLTQKAFYLADKFQVPVFILTDQYFLDSYMLSESFDVKRQSQSEQNIIKTDTNYLRYKLTEDGISPRGIPNFGDGIVCVDSDEHTEAGYITEDFDTRVNMVEKRLKKFVLINKEVIMPELIGNKDYKYLLVCWGSNYHIAKAALAVIGRDDLALLHFSQLYPLSKETIKYFTAAKKVIVVENNATAQFAALLYKELNVTITDTIAKYNGLSFSVEEMIELITKRI